jgi:hypothetical protein
MTTKALPGARHLFEKARARGDVFHIWGHSWELEATDDWSQLRSLPRYIADQGRVTFVTDGELVELLWSQTSPEVMVRHASPVVRIVAA